MFIVIVIVDLDCFSEKETPSPDKNQCLSWLCSKILKLHKSLKGVNKSEEIKKEIYVFLEHSLECKLFSDLYSIFK